MEGEVEPVPAAPLLPSDVKYDEKKMLLHKLDRLVFRIFQKQELSSTLQPLPSALHLPPHTDCCHHLGVQGIRQHVLLQ